MGEGKKALSNQPRSWRRFVLRRLLFVIPQLVGISIITFILVRALPANPAHQLAGRLPSEARIEQIEKDLALDQSLPVQYLRYIENVIQGDFGTSIFTGQPVLDDLRERFPATLELISVSLLLSLLIMIPLAVLAARRKGWWGKITDRFVFGYGMLAGALPDFWLGLLLAFLFFYKLGWVPAPSGRLAADVFPPETITGLYLVDSVLQANWAALGSAIQHLALPVLVLVFVYGGAVLKMTRFTILQVSEHDHVLFARACGVAERRIERRILRNASPPVVTILAVVYVFLIGGAVLVETVFSWGGLGQYAVQAVNVADYNALQGFVLVAAALSLVVYFLVDLAYFIIDPRVRI